jgi:hypothetical protein
MRPLLIAAAASLTAACAGGSAGGTVPAPAPAPAATTVMQQAAQAEPPKPRDIDPTGTYGVQLTYGGMPISVTLYLAKRDDGTWGGSITADQVPAMQLSNITLTGKKLSASMTSPDGAAVTMEFTIDGVDLTGSWRGANGDGSPMVGKKTP